MEPESGRRLHGARAQRSLRDWPAGRQLEGHTPVPAGQSVPRPSDLIYKLLASDGCGSAIEGDRDLRESYGGEQPLQRGRREEEQVHLPLVILVQAWPPAPC